MKILSDTFSRRAALATVLSACSVAPPLAAFGSGVVSKGAPELSNSIVASRDTNVSPKEIYDHLKLIEDEIGAKAILGDGSALASGRCLDLGAGAGVSTQTLWDMGWRDVVAVDPSRLAWDRFAASSELPKSVRFYHASDEEYLRLRQAEASEAAAAEATRFDLVVVNYAINHEKAVRFSKELLSSRGRLLAPTNVQDNYWFEQVQYFL